MNRVRFNTQGNKFGVADNDGNLSLWQMSLTTHNGRPFYVSSALTRYTHMPACNTPHLDPCAHT